MGGGRTFWRRALLAAVLCWFGAGALHAVQPDEVLPDATLEGRARALSRELRCMVCQNQSIDDSDAPLARDLRLLVRERLRAGDTDSQVIGFLTARYGEFVLLKPRLTPQTLLLWLAPLTVLVTGSIALVLVIRRRPGQMASAAQAETKPLTPQEERRLSELLKTGSSDRG